MLLCSCSPVDQGGVRCKEKLTEINRCVCGRVDLIFERLFCAFLRRDMKFIAQVQDAMACVMHVLELSLSTMSPAFTTIGQELLLMFKQAGHFFCL